MDNTVWTDFLERFSHLNPFLESEDETGRTYKLYYHVWPVSLSGTIFLPSSEGDIFEEIDIALSYGRDDYHTKAFTAFNNNEEGEYHTGKILDMLVDFNNTLSNPIEVLWADLLGFVYKTVGGWLGDRDEVWGVSEDEYGWDDEDDEDLETPETDEDLRTGFKSFLQRFGRDNGDKSKEVEEVSFDEVDTVVFQGKTFVLTGDFQHNEDRDVVKSLIVKAGGKCTGAVSGKTDYLVIGGAGNEGLSKIQSAKDFQAKGKPVKIISEEMLFKHL